MSTHSLLRFAPLFRPQRGLLAVCVLGLVGATGVGLAGPWLVAEAIDAVVDGDPSRVYTLAAVYLVLVVAQLALAWTSRIGIERVAQAAMVRLKLRLFDHLIGHDLAFFDHNPSGRLITRVQGDCQALQVLITEVILASPADLVLMVGMFVMLWVRSPAMAGLVFALVPPYAMSVYVFRKVSPALYLADREVRARQTGFLTEHIRAMPILQRFERSSWLVGRFEELNTELYRREVRASLAHTWFFNAIFMVRAIGFGFVLWLGSSLVARGVVSVGVLVMAMGYIRQMFNPLMRLSHNIGTIERARASAVRIGEILDRPRQIVDPARPAPWPGHGPNGALARGIEFDAIEFAYDRGERVLKGVQIAIGAGERIGIVGTTGSGKSTLLALLMRFRDPTSGSVRIDGVDLRALSVSELRSHMGLVLQDVQLFPGTVLDNLGGDRDRASRALKNLGLSIRLDANIAQEGSNLSRGERQLLTFARAIVNDPAILILDEATSAVDPATEARVQVALEQIMRGRTTLIVAHRLATVRDCDRIYVMGDGQVIEVGTHDELLAIGGRYAALHQLQHGEAA